MSNERRNILRSGQTVNNSEDKVCTASENIPIVNINSAGNPLQSRLHNKENAYYSTVK